MTFATVVVPPWLATLVLVGLPLAAWLAYINHLASRDLTDTDRYCGLVDRELDAGVVEDWETRQELEDDRVRALADQLDEIQLLPVASHQVLINRWMR